MQRVQPPPRYFPPARFSLARTLSTPNLSIEAEFPVLCDGSGSGSCAKTVPTFNDDGRYFTPAFILGFDRASYEGHLGHYWRLHEERATDSQRQSAKILLPRPSRNNSYCCVCKAPFQDYLTHTALSSHQHALTSNHYHRLIQELCQTVQTDREKPRIEPNCEMEAISTSSKSKTRPSKRKPIAKLAFRRSRETCSEESLKTVEMGEGVKA